MKHVTWTLVCVACSASYPGDELRHRCECGGVLDVIHDFDAATAPIGLAAFDRRLGSREREDRSGVWRYRELVLPVAASDILCRGEGNTGLYYSPRVAEFTGVGDLCLKHEGENPTGSFKDRGMTVGVTMARLHRMDRVACASTGNTSASMASYAALAGMTAIVFIPEGKIAYGKLCQALAYGALTLQIPGDFDVSMKLVEEVCAEEGVYLLNSVNPFRIEGQKAIGFELLQDMKWEVPDWIVVPGGNLGNGSAIIKGLRELRDLELIDRLPRLAVIQAEGANPLYTAYTEGHDLTPMDDPDTLATAIKIGNPVSWRKSLRAIRETDGIVDQVSDEEILEAKAVVDAAGVGAEPASCATVAGIRSLVEKGIMDANSRVAAVLTGHLLKDPDIVVGYHTRKIEAMACGRANAPIQVEATASSVAAAIRKARPLGG
ncbi:MAG: threonine synthase [Armatimonadia bacterium]|nr:threonine synthase [Armatimonadia bacterium]